MTTIVTRAGKGSPLTNNEMDTNLTNLNTYKIETSAIGSTVQAYDADLAAIAGLAGTSGILTKTAANTWSLDTNSYLTTSSAASTYQPLSGMSSYLTTAAAASTYQTQAGMSSYLTTASAASTYLTQSNAASTYQTQSGMSSYLTTASASSTYAPLTSASLTTPTLTSPSMVGTLLEDVYTITDGAGFSIDPTNGSVQLITLGASRTPVAANWDAGEAITLMVDDGTAYTITWTSSTFGGSGVVWKTNAGVAPTLNTTGYTAIVLWKVGTQVYGARVGDS